MMNTMFGLRLFYRVIGENTAGRMTEAGHDDAESEPQGPASIGGELIVNRHGELRESEKSADAAGQPQYLPPDTTSQCSRTLQPEVENAAGFLAGFGSPIAVEGMRTRSAA